MLTQYIKYIYVHMYHDSFIGLLPIDLKIFEEKKIVLKFCSVVRL